MWLALDSNQAYLIMQFVTCGSLEDDVEKLKKERDEALKEMSKLKVMLNFNLFYFRD